VSAKAKDPLKALRIAPKPRKVGPTVADADGDPHLMLSTLF
jgi:hypothetical protein